jgi:hypothetical protein
MTHVKFSDYAGQSTAWNDLIVHADAMSENVKLPDTAPRGNRIRGGPVPSLSPESPSRGQNCALRLNAEMGERVAGEHRRRALPVEVTSEDEVDAGFARERGLIGQERILSGVGIQTDG